MLLIEHATVITLDRERRILADGSVLVDGRDIVQVGPGRGPCARPGRPTASSTGGAASSCRASSTRTSTCRST